MRLAGRKYSHPSQQAVTRVTGRVAGRRYPLHVAAERSPFAPPNRGSHLVARRVCFPHARRALPRTRQPSSERCESNRPGPQRTSPKLLRVSPSAEEYRPRRPLSLRWRNVRPLGINLALCLPERQFHQCTAYQRQVYPGYVACTFLFGTPSRRRSRPCVSGRLSPAIRGMPVLQD